VIFGVSHVNVPVRDLRKALRIYRDCLEFSVKQEGEEWVELDGGSMFLRLFQTKKPERPSSFRLQSSEVEADVQRLINAGVTLLYEPHRTPELTIESSLRDPDGNTLVVWRALSEDEYGFSPELPKELVWDHDAETLLKSMLKAVPALFRGLARRKIVAEAERRAVLIGRVDRELTIRSYISAQSPPNRGRLIEPLKEHGINPDDYRDEFDS
jgi:predicted enzyme related to lactoylglutathione lyase